MTVRNRILGLLAIGALLTGVSSLTAQRVPGASPASEPAQPLFVVELKRHHLGGGVAISPDGGTLAYIGNDNGLYSRHLSSGQEALLLKEVGPGLDVFSDPAFSPDGTRVLFAASGGTYYYPSDIYSIAARGSDLKQLTQSKALPPGGQPAVGNAIYGRYFYAGQFSPDGTKILLRLYDAASSADNVAFMDADGSHLETACQGEPILWSAYGKAIYYSEDGTVRRFNLPSREIQTIVGLKGTILGKLPDRDWFGVDTGENISLIAVRDASAETMKAWEVPRVRLSVPDGQAAGSRYADQLILTSFQWSRSGRVLLVYEGKTTERFEVVEAPKL